MLPADREPAVRLGDRQPEAAQLGEPANHRLGQVEVLAVDLLGDGPDPLGREPVERVADQLELVVEVRRTAAVPVQVRRDLVEEGGGPMRLDERQRGSQVGDVHPPERLPAHQPGREVGDRVGDEQPSQHRLVLAVLAVSEQGPPGLEPAGRVREVVGEHLVVVERRATDPPVPCDGVREPVPGGVDDDRRVVEGRCRGRERLGHPGSLRDRHLGTPLAGTSNREGIRGARLGASGATLTPAMPTTWPLVGRASGLAAVTAAMDSDLAGVVLAGPPGVGKTRLATETLELARARGWSSAMVRANRAAASIPFGAFAPHLPRAFATAQGEADALRQAAQGLLAGAGDSRVLLIVDDAHELDDASAALVHLLAESGSVFLVVTIRAGVELAPPVTSLWKDELLERIDVPALDTEASAQLVESALGGPVDGATGLALWRASGGNCLFLRELIIGGRDAGTLREVGGLWRLTGALAPSTRLGEVVGLRLGRLTDEEREVVELVALGEPVSLDDLVALVHGRCVDELERRALLEVQVEGRRRQVRMGHTLFGDVVRAGMPERRRQEPPRPARRPPRIARRPPPGGPAAQRGVAPRRRRRRGPEAARRGGRAGARLPGPRPVRPAGAGRARRRRGR